MKGDKSAIKPELREKMEALQNNLQTNFKTQTETEDAQTSYAELFKPVEQAFGKLDKDTLVAIVGFPLGGPPNISTVGLDRGEQFVSYLTCELACYQRQKPSSVGPYEVLITSNDQTWARSALTSVGQMSFEAALDDGHSLDLGPQLEASSKLQGLIFERFSDSKIKGKQFGILRAIGVTRAELDWCREHSVEALVEKLKAAGIYPLTDVNRDSVRL